MPLYHTFADWRESLDTLIAGLEKAEVTAKLWIIQQKTIQEYQQEE